ncbi:keratin-associated protein 13-1-like [Elephas maximus indicus]|uniref:keratin-associated protein 13-1-like n=1 Tax=Elephas maximus indicus TaxID=99487 RepID=UPI0021161348|nr:keratin-associated protein 13-1-like [Elephas maximus indicus]
MSYSCCSGKFSSRSLGGCVRFSSPSHLVYSTGLCSPSTCQLGSSLYRGCKPSSYQRSCVVSSPCQISCYQPRTSMLCSPCQTTYNASLGFGSRSSCSLGYGSRGRYSLSCGSSGFRPLSYGICGFPSLGYRPRICRPTCFPFRSCPSSCY